MWRYRCPICKEVVTEENMNKESVEKIKRYSHICPKCGGTLYVHDSGRCLDLGEMLVKALELSTGIILSREEALSHYIEA